MNKYVYEPFSNELPSDRILHNMSSSKSGIYRKSSMYDSDNSNEDGYGNGISDNNGGGNENGNSYGIDGNEGNGKGNNPMPVGDGVYILIFFAIIFIVIKKHFRK